MNQSAISGLGNIYTDYTDEILFGAGVAPKRRLGELTRPERDRLYTQLRHVCDVAIECGADPASFPEDWLIHARSPGAACPRCGDGVEKLTVSGRAGYWCPTCQGGTPGQ